MDYAQTSGDSPVVYLYKFLYENYLLNLIIVFILCLQQTVEQRAAFVAQLKAANVDPKGMFRNAALNDIFFNWVWQLCNWTSKPFKSIK